jgi:hypothetical protein
MRSSNVIFGFNSCDGIVGRFPMVGPSEASCWVPLAGEALDPEDSNELKTSSETCMSYTNLIVTFAAILYSVGCTAGEVVQDEREQHVVQTHQRLPPDHHRRYGRTVRADECSHLPVESPPLVPVVALAEKAQ